MQGWLICGMKTTYADPGFVCGVRQAPGYSAVIARPMDFATIRARLDAGGYRSWDALAGDMALMFDNAMKFNRPDTVYHKQARRTAAGDHAVLSRMHRLRSASGMPGGQTGTSHRQKTQDHLNVSLCSQAGSMH